MTPLRVMSVNIRYDNPKDGPNRWCFRKKSGIEKGCFLVFG